MFSGLILFLLVTVIQIFSFELKFIIFYQDLNWSIHLNYIEIFFLLMLFPLFCRSIIDNLVNPVQEHSEEWKKSVAQLDKEHAKGRRLSKDIPIFFTAFVICDVLKS